MERYTTVPAYLDGHEDWREVLEYLRDILRETDLWETVKWGGPCYTINNKNVIGLGAFKEFVSVWFFQGVLLKDTHHVLVNAKEGKAKALRQWRFGMCQVK